MCYKPEIRTRRRYLAVNAFREYRRRMQISFDRCYRRKSNATEKHIYIFIDLILTGSSFKEKSSIPIIYTYVCVLEDDLLNLVNCT